MNDVRSERANAVGDRHECLAADLERVVPEVEALELGAERGRGALGLSMADLLHALDGLPVLLPELAGLAALPVGEREHVRSCRPPTVATAIAPPARQTKSAECAPTTRSFLRHDAPASRLDCVTISSRVSSSSNPAPRRRSAHSARPSSTGG